MTQLPKIIFSHCTMEKLANDVAVAIGAVIGKISWNKFDDGWPKLFIEDADQIKNKDIVFIANLEKPETLFEQVAIMYALPMHLAKSFKVIIPFYPVGTMERVSVYGEIATAKSLARILSAIPRFPTIVFVDIHALQMQFYFDDNRVMPELASAIPFLKDRIKNISNVAIAFPDDGAYKRFGQMFPEYPHIVCNKVRKADGTKVVTIKQGYPLDKHVVIVDDLTQTGGTLIECREALMQKHAAKVSAFVTHGVFAKDSWKKFTPDLFANIWFTDSCPSTVEAVKLESLFEILSLTQLIAELM